MNIFIIVIGTLLSAFFFRCGGLGKDFIERKPKYKNFKWLFKSIVRDSMCSIIMGLCVFFLYEDIPLYLNLISSGLLFAALTTYNKGWLNELFAKNKEKLHWYNYAFTGGLYGLSSLPLTFGYVAIHSFGIRVIALAGLAGLFGCLRNAWPRELGLGASIIATLIIWEFFI